MPSAERVRRRGSTEYDGARRLATGGPSNSSTSFDPLPDAPPPPPAPAPVVEGSEVPASVPGGCGGGTPFLRMNCGIGAMPL